MTGSTIIFYLLAAFTLVSAMAAIITRQIFRAAIFLLFTLMGIAGLYFWMQYDFVAAVQIIVYVGGITVLIIFSIFLTQQAGDQLPRPANLRLLLTGLLTLISFVFIIKLIFQYLFTGDNSHLLAPSVINVGHQLLSTDGGGFALPFELVSILLLASLIGCIVIAINKKESTSLNAPIDNKGCKESDV